MNTATRIATPNQLHQHLFAPLTWLDQLDEAHFCRSRLCPSLDAPLRHTLTQLQHALEPLDQSLAWHPLLDCQRQAVLLQALQERQGRIAELIRQLRPRLKRLLRNAPEDATPPEALWDEISDLAPRLQEQLIRYLPLLEQAFQLQRARARHTDSQPPAALLFPQHAVQH